MLLVSRHPQQLWCSALSSGQHYSNHCQIRCHFQKRADQVQDQDHQRAGQQRGADLPVPHGRRDRGRDQLHHEREPLFMLCSCDPYVKSTKCPSSCASRYAAVTYHVSARQHKRHLCPLGLSGSHRGRLCVLARARCNRLDPLTAGSSLWEMPQMAADT